MKDGPRQFTELEKQTGMLEEHLLVIAKLSLANDIVIAFRPVNESVKQRFVEGCVGKGMDIKGKSADQGIALNGLIPVDAEFSKLGTTDSYDAIKKYNGYNSEKIAKDQGRYDKIKETDVSQLGSLKLGDFEDSLKNLATTVPLVDKQNQQIYGFKDKDGHALKDKDNKMIFATKDKDGFHLEGTGAAFVPPASCKETAIEVLSYRNLKVENNKLVEKEPTAITADYDQLFAATTVKDMATPRGIPGQEYAGIATPTNHAITTALAADTKNKLAISHAPETGNPCPEDLSDANYVVFVPSDKLKKQFETAKANGEKQDVAGCIKILKNEKEIIDFYNEKEKDGYSIPVNDMWGWQRNNDGKLEVNPDRLSAQTLDLEIKKYEGNKEATAAAEALKIQYKELGKLKLEEPGGDRNERIAKHQEKFNGMEVAFQKAHTEIPPTKIAREDAQARAGVQKEPQKERKTSKAQEAPNATPPAPDANPATDKNNTVDNPRNGVDNSKQQAKFDRQEDNFAEKYAVIPPTQQVRQDAQAKEAPNATPPAPGANPATDKNNTVNKPRNGVNNSQQQAKFDRQEDNFAEKYAVIPPTQQVRQDAQAKAELQKAPEKELETSKTQGAPQVTPPIQAANQENKTLDKSAGIAYNPGQSAQSGFSLNRGLSLDLAKIKEASKGLGIKTAPDDAKTAGSLSSPQTPRAITAQSPTISPRHLNL